MRVPEWFKLAAGLSLLGVASCYGPGAIVDDYPASYALLYGTVRDAAQAPVVNALVVTWNTLGARTDSVGRYRLPTTTMGISGGIMPSTVMVYRMGPSGPPTDSSSVAAQIPFFSSNPPPDSLRVDIVVGWTQ
jgi:hypothetical protein